MDQSFPCVPANSFVGDFRRCPRMAGIGIIGEECIRGETRRWLNQSGIDDRFLQLACIVDLDLGEPCLPSHAGCPLPDLG